MYEQIILILLLFIFVTYIFAALKSRFRAQLYFENILTFIFNLSAICTIVIALAIILTIFIEAIHFLNLVSIENFLFDKKWSPQSSTLSYKDSFGILPILTGTFLVTFIALAISIPIGIGSAIYLSEYISKTKRNIIKPIIELLAGIPTIVYGYFAALTVGPAIRKIGITLGIEVSTESALAAGIVLGIMIIPFILSFTEQAIYAVPKNLRDASLALGSTKAETILNVVLPAASPGIFSAILLASSRAIGETMIVTMAAGISANLTLDPLNSVSTFTAQIVNLLIGDQEFDSPKTLAAYALALVLFIITLIINICAIICSKSQQKKYD